MITEDRVQDTLERVDALTDEAVANLPDDKRRQDRRASVSRSVTSAAGTDIPRDKKKSPRGRGPKDRTMCARNSNESRTPAPATLVDLIREALAAMQAAGLPFESLEINSGWQRAPGQDHYWYIADSGIGPCHATYEL